MNAPLKTPRIVVGRYDVVFIHVPGRLPLQAGLYRAVWINRKSDLVHLLRFPARPTRGDVSTGNERVKQILHRPVAVSLRELEELVRSRQASPTKAQLPARYNIEDDELTKYEKSVKERRLSIADIFGNEDNLHRIFEHRQMGRYVSDFVKRHHDANPGKPRMTRSYVYQVAYRFWLFECCEGALIADSANCGAKGKFRNPGIRKRGRTANRVKLGHDITNVGRSWGPDDRTYIWLAWDMWGGKKLAQFSGPHRRMLERWYTSHWERSESGEWTPKLLPKGQRPSSAMFRYYVRRRWSPLQLLKKLIPEMTWKQTRRALKDKTHGKLFGPAHTYIIDSTVADVYLVSRFNRRWIIGRPIVYLIRDAWSGMIVGLHVALEGPSWHTARFALFNAFSPKGKFLRSFGFDMTDEDWPCAHGSLNLVHDRAEQLSIPSADSARELRFVLVACPSFRSDMKGAIETMFNWLNKATIHWMPGAVLSRARERGQRDCRLDATLTLHEFTRIVIHAVLTFNKTGDVLDRFTPEMHEAGVPNSRIGIWKWGLENLHGAPPQWSRDTLYKTLLPSGDATIRETGVHFAGRCYQGRFGDQQQWQELARSFHSKKIKIKYDTVFPREIHVRNESTGGYETLTLAPFEKVPDEARLEDILDFKQYRALVAEDEEDPRIEASIAHTRFAEAEVEKAKEALAKSTPPGSKAEHISGIRENRDLEAQVQRVFDALSQRTSQGLSAKEDSNSEDEFEEPADLMEKLLALAAEEA